MSEGHCFYLELVNTAICIRTSTSKHGQALHDQSEEIGKHGEALRSIHEAITAGNKSFENLQTEITNQASLNGEEILKLQRTCQAIMYESYFQSLFNASAKNRFPYLDQRTFNPPGCSRRSSTRSLLRSNGSNLLCFSTHKTDGRPSTLNGSLARKRSLPY